MGRHCNDKAVAVNGSDGGGRMAAGRIAIKDLSSTTSGGAIGKRLLQRDDHGHWDTVMTLARGRG